MKKLKTFDQVMEDLKKVGPEHKRMVETSESVNRLVDQIVNERIKQGLSQRDLAKKSGLKQPAIARFETLETLPTISTLVKITNALNLKVHALSENDIAEIEEFRFFKENINYLYVLSDNQWNDQEYKNEGQYITYIGGQAYESISY